MGFALIIYKRHSGIRFCDDRHGCHFFHVGYNRFQLIRAYGTVQADSCCSHLLQSKNSFHGIASVHSTSVCFQRQCADHRDIADCLKRIQRYHRLIYAQHGLCNNQIYPCIDQCFQLFFIRFIQLRVCQHSSRLHQLTGSRQVTGNQRTSANSVLTDLDQFCIQLLYFILKIKISEADRIGCKCGSVYDLASGIHISTL